MTPRATVIIPTFEHGPLLRLAVESVRRQTESRLQIFIIGDGATDETRREAESQMQADDRVRFVAFAKDSSRGEPYRHLVLREAAAPIVCYLADDDLWTADHVETMLDLLLAGDGADLAMTLQVRVAPADGTLTLGPPRYVDLTRRSHRRLFGQPTSGYANGMSCVAHTLSFYRSLPYGWRRSPPGIATDGWMWKQLVDQPSARVAARCRATAIHFHSPPRRHWPLARRLDEMTRFNERFIAGGWDNELRRLEQISSRRSSFRTIVELAWMQLHWTRVTGVPAMRLAKAVVNRPVP